VIPIKCENTKDDQKKDYAEAQSEAQDKFQSPFKPGTGKSFCRPVEEAGKEVMDLQKGAGKEGKGFLKGAPNPCEDAGFYGFATNRAFGFGAHHLLFAKRASEAIGGVCPGFFIRDPPHRFAPLGIFLPGLNGHHAPPFCRWRNCHDAQNCIRQGGLKVFDPWK
jgi:hypothetical protein